MKLACWLNMAQPDLAKAEALTLLQGKEKEMIGDLLIVEAPDWQHGTRLAFTRAIYEYWWGGPEEELWNLVDHYAWKKSVTGSFSVSVHHSRIPAKKVADRIWHWLENPVVKLKNPDMPIVLFFAKNKVVCGKFLWANTEDFEARKSHTRSENIPISCHPRTARALVNLSGAPTGAQFLDPFCGTGGLLIEAALMGLRARGSDVDKEMVERTRKNCDDLNLECEVQVKDALHLYSPEKYVATELPFGRNTGKKTTKELEELYAGFLERLQEFLRVRAVVAYPHNVNFDKLVKKTGLRIIANYSEYIHRSLTKKIVVLEPKKSRNDGA